MSTSLTSNQRYDIVTAVPSGRPMVNALLIENFRCFERLSLHGLRRVNVIVGGSSSGKTALLEAIFLAASASPDVALKLRSWRGLGRTVKFSDIPHQFEGLFADIFSARDTSRRIVVKLLGSPQTTRSVAISFGEQASLDVPSGTSGTAAPLRPLVFAWTDANDESASGDIKISEGQLKITASGQQAVTGSFLNTVSTAEMTVDAADRWSQLSINNQEGDVVDSVRSLFSDVTGVSVEVVGGTPAICVSVKSLPFKVPVGLYSAGAQKLIGLLVTIPAVRNGVILIDEIENSLHYKSHDLVWRKWA